ncbi:M18 family aminopeptidase [Niameybacter massiliensis]|uniref:M18 family aminopeptidase n=1 Tax=Holtiella tumoricola TaxID=3018743 RepID=A0AA42DQC1_9FIRM|nr:M18 family aminopeptidase [Holtiella tumoricola]MDA3733394.1 M18 family aminopeptidase [Holtiella tumoricola]
MSNLLVNGLLSFLDKSTSMFHAADSVIQKLESEGFSFLDSVSNWELQEGGKYYVTSNHSAVIAFTVNSTSIENEGFKIVGAHTDIPGFKIKPNPQMSTESYVKLNTEIYGGPIVNTWLDRPLSAAGRVALKGSHPLHPTIQLVDLEKPILIIPNLAIHMNREVNNGVKLNPQKETLPILTYMKEKIEGNLILEEVAKKLGVASSDILEMDLFLYPVEKSCLVGLNEEFISAARLDDLSMVYSGLDALINSTSTCGINVLACFDNEEVGSTSKQGANSPLLNHTLERIAMALGKSRDEYLRSLAMSFIISADVAHLLHPNYPEKSDPTNKVLPGNGPAIKLTAGCSYTTDSDSFGVFANLCASNNIPYQVFVNRSDERGGSTIGPVTASHLGVRSIDIGTPMLSMHSARELMATSDFIHTTSAMAAFFNL